MSNAQTRQARLISRRLMVANVVSTTLAGWCLIVSLAFAWLASDANGVFIDADMAWWAVVLMCAFLPLGTVSAITSYDIAVRS